MNLALKIARRYIVSKKSTNVINIIAGVSMTGMGVGSLALVLVLSVFNGFEGLVISLYHLFDPDLKVTLVEGKTFTLAPEKLERLHALDEVAALSQVLEENALLKYRDNEYIARLKGVDDHFAAIAGIDSTIIRGDFMLKDQGKPLAVIGAGVEQQLGVNLENVFNTIRIYMPRRTDKIYLNPDQAFKRQSIRPAGVFSIQQEFDSKYLFVPIEFMRNLLEYREPVISALEIRLSPGAEVDEARVAALSLLGEGFRAQSRFEQNETLYKVMQTEKWATYAILTFILLVAAFNIIGSLSMLVIEKTKDIAILKTMGATPALIKRIFLFEGVLSSMIGAISGIALATLICFVQQEFGLLKLQGSGTFVIEAYPVQMQWPDFALVFATVVIISLLASWIPAQRAASQEQILKEE